MEFTHILHSKLWPLGSPTSRSLAAQESESESHVFPGHIQPCPDPPVYSRKERLAVDVALEVTGRISGKYSGIPQWILVLLG